MRQFNAFHLVLLIATLITACFVPASYSQQVELDSLERELRSIKQTGNGSVEPVVESLLRLRSEEPRRVESLVYNALLLSHTIHDTKGEIRALRGIGQIQIAAKMYDSALVYYNRSLSLSKTTGYHEGAANALRGIGVIYYYTDNRKLALEYYQNSLRLCKKIVYLEGEEIVLNNLGFYYRGSDRVKSLMYYKQSLSILEEMADTSSRMFWTLMDVGDNLFETGSFVDALRYYQQGLLVAERNHNRQRTVAVLN